MLDNIWEVLGSEPTTDKKMMHKANILDQYDDDIDRYIALLEKKLIGYATRKDLYELADLFQDNRFCFVLGLNKFKIRFEEVMEYYEVWNQDALAVLLQQTQKMLNEGSNVTNDLIDIKNYFETKVKKKKIKEERNRFNISELKNIKLLCLAIASLIYIIRVIIIQSGAFALWTTPNKEDVCYWVNEEYGINVGIDDIVEVLEKSDKTSNMGNNSRSVEYHIVYEEDGITYDFIVSCEGDSASFRSDLQYNLLKIYMETYLNETNYSFSDEDGYSSCVIQMQPEIRNSDDIELFIGQLKDMLKNYFGDPIMANNYYGVNIDILTEYSSETLSFRIEDHNYLGECLKLSKELEAYITGD